MRQTKRVLDEASEASTLPVDDAAQADEIARLQSALDTERARAPPAARRHREHAPPGRPLSSRPQAWRADAPRSCRCWSYSTRSSALSPPALRKGTSTKGSSRPTGCSRPRCARRVPSASTRRGDRSTRSSTRRSLRLPPRYRARDGNPRAAERLEPGRRAPAPRPGRGRRVSPRSPTRSSSIGPRETGVAMASVGMTQQQGLLASRAGGGGGDQRRYTVGPLSSGSGWSSRPRTGQPSSLRRPPPGSGGCFGCIATSAPT